jgi:hypothetical protein
MFVVLALVELIVLVAGCLDRPSARAQPLTKAATATARPRRQVTAPPPASSPAVSVARLYCFARPAGRAIYITIDDGWTPSAAVLALMHTTYLPITAFLIADAAREHLSYWRAFAAAGGLIGDHTVSHPDLTKLARHLNPAPLTAASFAGIAPQRNPLKGD